MPLTPTEKEFLKDLRHVEQQFTDALEEAKKEYYADLAMGIWRTISALCAERIQDRCCLPAQTPLR